MTVLDVATAYRLWAPHYALENAVSAIEDRLVKEMTPPLAGKRLLDAGCGTGRRLAVQLAGQMTGVDQSAEMLAVARASCPPEVTLLQGDVRALPVEDAAADITWCRLVLGHLPDARQAYRELARATAPGGWVIVSDFHPDADAAGHRRTFRAGEEVLEVEHYRHSVLEHLADAGHAGLRATGIEHGAIGDEVRAFYDDKGRHTQFQRDFGLNVVLALAFRRTG